MHPRSAWSLPRGGRCRWRPPGVEALALAVWARAGRDRRGHPLDTTRVALPGAYVPARDAPARRRPRGDAQDHRPACRRRWSTGWCVTTVAAPWCASAGRATPPTPRGAGSGLRRWSGPARTRLAPVIASPMPHARGRNGHASGTGGREHPSARPPDVGVAGHGPRPPGGSRAVWACHPPRSAAGVGATRAGPPGGGWGLHRPLWRVPTPRGHTPHRAQTRPSPRRGPL